MKSNLDTFSPLTNAGYHWPLQLCASASRLNMKLVTLDRTNRLVDKLYWNHISAAIRNKID